MILLCTAPCMGLRRWRIRRHLNCGKGEASVQQVEVAVIGTGWCGGIRAETLARSSIVDQLHICEIRPDRLAEVKKLTNAATATLDYHDILKNDRVKVGFHPQPHGETTT